jgi:hypothetical protein
MKTDNITQGDVLILKDFRTHSGTTSFVVIGTIHRTPEEVFALA